MKKIVVALLLFFVAFTGCSNSHRSSTVSWFEENEKIKVLSTTAMIDDLVGQIGQERVAHISLIHGEVDPHSYELVKGDDEKFDQARIVFANGLNLEHGASLCYRLQNHPQPVFIGNEIQKAVPDRILRVGNEVDPHVWMDISLWSEGIDSIVSALSSEDPQHSAFYKRNGDLLRQKMLTVHFELQKKMQEIPDEKRYLVTSHDAFHYFAAAYLGSQDRCIAPEGFAPEGQLSSADIKRVVEALNAHHIDVIFPESNVSRDALKKVAACSDHEVRISSQSLYGDAMGADNYLEMIQHNVKVLIEEWKAS